MPFASAQQDDAGQIRELLERVATLMQAGDLDPLDAIYAAGPGVHIIEGAGVNHGWVDYRDHHLKPELAAFESAQAPRDNQCAQLSLHFDGR